MGSWFRWIKNLRENLWKKLEGVKAGWRGAGNTYFVDGSNGLNTNDGLTRDTPLETIAAALDKCLADHDDYILVLDCWQQETFPISVDVSRVHIIGVDNGNGKFPRMNASGNTAIFSIAAEYIEIANLSLNGGPDHAAIEWAITGGRGAIRKCWFGETGAGLYGIWVATHDAVEMLIEDCRFGSGITSDGIRLAGNMTRGVIRRCLFRVGAIGINVSGHMELGWILSNRFVCYNTDAAGCAITLTNSNGIFVDDNRANIGKTAMTANPYVDGGTNNWAANYKAHALTLP